MSCDKFMCIFEFCSGFRDLQSVLPVNQHLSFAIQISNDVTEVPPLSLFDSFQSKGIFYNFRIIAVNDEIPHVVPFLSAVYYFLNWHVLLIVSYGHV